MQAQLQPIGEWREHLPYNSAIDVTAGIDKIYCATPYSLFTVAKNNHAIERMSRVTGLNETGISAIRFDSANNRLFIAYANSNIDIIDRNDIYNVPDIKRSSVVGDKNIYNIYPLGRNFYLSAGIGVIVIDGDRYEVKDSWLIGNGGNPVKVNGFSSDATFFYAATDEGLKRTPLNTANPANYTNWQVVSGSNGLPATACKNILNAGGKMISQENDSLFILNGNAWTLLYGDGWPVVSSNVSAGAILLCERFANGNSRVQVVNANGSVARTLAQPNIISFPKKAILDGNDTWIADLYGCLSHFTSSAYEQYIPNSPQSTASGEMTVNNSILYATAGEVNDSWNYQYNGNGIFVFQDGIWNNINRYRYTAIDSLLDYVDIAIDPLDETIWSGSFGGGLLHVKPGPVFEIFKQNIIGPTVGDPTSYRVAGLAFDANHNLWVSNFGAAAPLLVRKQDGSWKSFSLPFSLNDHALTQIVIDNNNYKWIASPLDNGLICYDHGASIDDINDDHWRLYKSGPGNGNLPANEVLCIAKDKNGYIWAGTINGIGVIQCPQDAFSATGCEAILPVVPAGNFAGYLFNGQEVRSIAVDGADRKWIATKDGAWLISADGANIIYHLTEDNSSLLSSDVKKIAIDQATGEVYFATLKGICSFRSTATAPDENDKNILVFPNPVPPGYGGTIAIRGLTDQAIVKITEMDGRLVYQTRALGGQAVWDGKDYQGKRISTGIYLVLVSDDGKKEKKAATIIFINK